MSSPKTTTEKPKRPLTMFNLYYRFKRSKIVETTRNGDTDVDKDTIYKLITAKSGLENYPECMHGKIVSDRQCLPHQVHPTSLLAVTIPFSS